MQIVLLLIQAHSSFFVSVCGGVASDLLFDYKVGQMCNIKFNRMHCYQWFGLIVTSLSMGFFLWILFTTFKLGSPELFAQRGKARALLIQSTHFNMWVLALGIFFGWSYSSIAAFLATRANFIWLMPFNNDVNTAI